MISKTVVLNIARNLTPDLAKPNLARNPKPGPNIGMSSPTEPCGSGQTKPEIPGKKQPNPIYNFLDIYYQLVLARTRPPDLTPDAHFGSVLMDRVTSGPV